MQLSSLSRLHPGELCIVVLHDGTQREGAWNPEARRFDFSDGKGDGFVLAADVYEWWPASVKF